MSGAIDDLLDSFDTLSEDLYTELEEILVIGDVESQPRLRLHRTQRKSQKEKA